MGARKADAAGVLRISYDKHISVGGYLMLRIWGSAPNPEVYRFGFQGGNEKRDSARYTASPQTRPGARVAPQRCPVLPDGKAVISISQKSGFELFTLKIVLDKGSRTSDGRAPPA